MRLLILGDGEEWVRLRALADQTGFGNDISMPGPSQNPYPDMAACAALALTSASEGLSLVLLETLALGTRCVATDCPMGPRQILNDQRLGKLVPVGDIEALADAFVEAVDLRQGERPEDREFRNLNIVRRFGMDAMLDRYERLLADLNGTPQSRFPASR